jgi:hypothetical protein
MRLLRLFLIALALGAVAGCGDDDYNGDANTSTLVDQAVPVDGGAG